MKKTFRPFLCILISCLLLFSCRLSTNDLSKEVIKSMEEEWKSDSIKIKSLVLTNKSNNEYTGVLQTNEPNGDFTYSVEVTYDGDNMTWKIVE